METLFDINQRDYQRSFNALKESAIVLSKSKSKDRIKRLNSILTFLSDEENIDELEKAIYNDFRKSSSEFKITELTPVISNLKFIKRNLRYWMQDKAVDTPLVLFGTSSFVRYQAKGVVLIITPWNYPFNLSIIPILYAIAAGNAIVLKPSEMTPHTTGYISKMMGKLFPSSEIQVFEGDANVATALLALPFNHIFFTGSPQIGKVVMEAASKNLTSLTLELGGKSPVIVDKNVNLKTVAEKLTWGKLTNAGQTCTAPDYILIRPEQTDALLSNIKRAIKTQYGFEANEIFKSPDYTRIVNKRHFSRIKNLLDDALSKGAKIEIGGHSIEEDDFIAPTVLSNLSEDMMIMQEEIFGPLLPIIPFESDEEALDQINKRPSPLVIYIMSKRRKTVDKFIQNTAAGGTLVNDVLIHYGNPDLPFGGINNSGMGKSNGRHGFLEFSNERGIMKQKFGTLKMIYPPYNGMKKKLIKFLNKLL